MPHPRNHLAITTRQRIGMIIAPGFLLVAFNVTPPTDLPIEAWKTACIAACMATLWVCETIPLPATALIPLILFPLFGISDIQSTALPYANPIIFLFGGGLIISLAIQRWNLHLRIALLIINFLGTSPRRLIAGFMIATAFFSMWISNTATVMMLYPVALSVITYFKKENMPHVAFKNFSQALLLGIAFAGGIGGIGTIIGTPPNALLVAYLLKNHQIEIGFIQWMFFALPIVFITLPLAHLILTTLYFPLSKIHLPQTNVLLAKQLHDLGPLTRNEIIVAIIALSTGTTWALRPWISGYIPMLTDTSISIFYALLLFIIPTQNEPTKGQKRIKFIMDWKYATKLPWGIFILFGGGLSLAQGIESTGLSLYIGKLGYALADWPEIIILVAILILLWSTTELASNTATVSTFLPIIASVALGLQKNILLFLIPATIIASCSFVLPVATPPNAIVYGSGHVKLKNMALTGLMLSALFLIILPIAIYTLGPRIFGI